MKEDAPLGDQYAWREQRRRQSSTRICVEHDDEHRQWRTLQRFIGPREYYAATHRAITGLVSDRAQRPTRHKPGTELVPTTSTAC